MEKVCEIIASVRNSVRKVYGDELAEDNEFVKAMFCKLTLDIPEMKNIVFSEFQKLIK